MEKTRIKDIFKTSSGCTPTSSNPAFYDSDDYRWLNSSEVAGRIYDTKKYISEKAFKKYTALKVHPKDTVVIAMYGATVGEIGILKVDSTTNQAVCAILPNYEIANPDYFYYKMLNEKQNLIGLASGSARTNISQQIIANYETVMPIMTEQNKVADVLCAIDDLIETNNKIIETSEKLMCEIYDYWFVQFDFPDENGRPYKTSGGEMVYGEKLKREVPKGWKVQNLLKNDLCKDIKPGIDKFDNVKTYYATADVIDGEMGIGTQIIYDNRESRANMQPKPNSVWFAKMKNSVKHITVMPASDDLLEKSVFSTGFFGLKCESETLPYIRNFIYSNYFEKVKNLNSNGATMEAISNDGIKNIELIIPDEMALKQYSDITSAYLAQNDILRKENAKLISLRDWLLPMLMNGQVKVEDD